MILRFDSVTSTQDVLRDLAERGAVEGTVVVAETQTAGRGRSGRIWESPRGLGLYVSVLVRPRVPPERLGLLTLATGVAVAEVIRIGKLKWPNDLLAPDGRKLAGILAEAEVRDGRLAFVLLGIGLNLHAENLRIPDAAALDEFAVVQVNLAERIAARVMELQYWLDAPEALVGAWKEWNVTLGRRVRVDGPGGVIEGDALDVDSSGALLVRLPSGEEARVICGDVELSR
jgi:BirA family biotin operon repressor/biotin-[acetyl-CoA-carboxylase] ligase